MFRRLRGRDGKATSKDKAPPNTTRQAGLPLDDSTMWYKPTMEPMSLDRDLPLPPNRSDPQMGPPQRYRRPRNEAQDVGQGTTTFIHPNGQQQQQQQQQHHHHPFTPNQVAVPKRNYSSEDHRQLPEMRRDMSREEGRYRHWDGQHDDDKATAARLVNLVLQGSEWSAADALIGRHPNIVGVVVPMSLLRHATIAYPLHAATIMNPPIAIFGRICDAFPKAAEIGDKECGRLPLHWACLAGASSTCLQMLLQVFPEGTKVVDTTLGRLPLHYIVLHATDIQQVITLLDAEPRGVKTKDKQSKTPLDLALECSSLLKTDILAELRKKRNVSRKALKPETSQEINANVGNAVQRPLGTLREPNMRPTANIDYSRGGEKPPMFGGLVPHSSSDGHPVTRPNALQRSRTQGTVDQTIQPFGTNFRDYPRDTQSLNGDFPLPTTVREHDRVAASSTNRDAGNSGRLKDPPNAMQRPQTQGHAADQTLQPFGTNYREYPRDTQSLNGDYPLPATVRDYDRVTASSTNRDAGNSGRLKDPPPSSQPSGGDARTKHKEGMHPRDPKNAVPTPGVRYVRNEDEELALLEKVRMFSDSKHDQSSFVDNIRANGPGFASEMDDAIATLKEQIVQYGREARQKEIELGVVNRKLDTMRAAEEDLSEELSRTTKDRDGVFRRLEQKRATAERLRQQIADLQARLAQEEAEIQTMTSSLTSRGNIQGTLKEFQSELGNLAAVRLVLEEEKASIDRTINNFESELKSLEAMQRMAND